MSYAVQGASWRRIVASIAERFVDAVEVGPADSARIDPAYVRVVASDGYTIDTQEPVFFYLRYYGPVPLTDGGAGRRSRRVRRRVRVYVYTRSSADFAGSDREALLAEQVGHADREEQVLDALDHFIPRDDTANALTVEPLHWVDSADGPPERRPEDDSGVVRSHLDFEVEYVARIKLADPPA